MSGFDRNPFAEPEAANPFAVRFVVWSICYWMSAVLCLLFAQVIPDGPTGKFTSLGSMS